MNTADNQHYNSKVVVLLLWIALVISICMEKVPESSHKYLRGCRHCSAAKSE